MKLQAEFYQNNNVLEISELLIGKILCTSINGELCSGIICETEAYAGVLDKASHAYGGKRTKRTETMFGKGGIAYVYLCYGIHKLFNVVTNNAEIPEAVLIRGIIPIDGINKMQERRKLKFWNKNSCIGPGKLSQALGIDMVHNGNELTHNNIWIEDRAIIVDPDKIVKSSRVGVDYAEEDALLPYRFQYFDF